MDQYRAFWARVPWWGHWVYYSVAFGVPTYFFIVGRSLLAAVFCGVAFGALNTSWVYFRRRQRASD